ncbi:hypothetical protein M9H77_29802 [Catharanthus roseus]|uniref:Uncharacterized protein n=1 Tax=Catharanthus roseus TaxID=4058 RepID=A0ACB9ZVH7_CATRO|nr:hypothetical protein M9H77_29802 [Catharanthus roseus]
MSILNVDGSVGEKHKGVRFILEDPNGHQYTSAMKFLFPVSNNKSEYKALLLDLCMAHNLEITHLRVRRDSQVVIGQVIGDFESKEDNMQNYLRCVQHLTSGFQQILLEKVTREKNVCVDMLSKLSSRKPIEDEFREQDARRDACCKKQVARYYNVKIKPSTIYEGDSVLRRKELKVTKADNGTTLILSKQGSNKSCIMK